MTPTAAEDGAAAGDVRILTCTACGYRIHPPVPRCPQCASRALDVRPVSGRASVWSFTTTTAAEPAEIVVIAVVELVEQPGLRLLTNLVGIAPDEVEIGMPVRATTTTPAGADVPVFEPDPAASVAP